MQRVSSLVGVLFIVAAILGAGWFLYMDRMDIKQLNSNQLKMNNYLVAEYDENLVEDRVIHLPEDGQAYYLTVITNSDWQARQDQREFIAWFDTNPKLASLKAQTHYHHYTDRDKLYSATLAPQYGSTLPVVILQENKGKVVYKASGKNIPGNSELLAQAIQNCCPRPEPKPGPGPTPNPNVNPKPPIPDMIKPVDNNTTDDLGILAMVIAGVVGALLGMRSEFRKI